MHRCKKLSIKDSILESEFLKRYKYFSYSLFWPAFHHSNTFPDWVINFQEDFRVIKTRNTVDISSDMFCCRVVWCISIENVIRKEARSWNYCTLWTRYSYCRPSIIPQCGKYKVSVELQTVMLPWADQGERKQGGTWEFRFKTWLEAWDCVIWLFRLSWCAF